MAEPKPAYRDRYPCPGCATGYLDCAQLWTMDRQCCAGCSHPGHAEADPAFTEAEVNDMRRRAGMPPVDRRVEVTLLGFELEIVGRMTVSDPPPPQLHVPVMRPLRHTFGEDAPLPALPFGAGKPAFEFDRHIYEHQGGGTYRRVR